MRLPLLPILLCLGSSAWLAAAETPAARPRAAEPPPEVRDSYHLSPRDLIRVTVFNEPDVAKDSRIDSQGNVSLELLGPVNVSRLTVNQAQEKIRQAYIAAEIFVRPRVSVSVIEYSARQISVNGQVKNPGMINLPIEMDSVDIVVVITTAGGVTRIGRADRVMVTRKSPNGTEQQITVDVEQMLNGRGGAKPFMVEPGDYIFVPERVL